MKYRIQIYRDQFGEYIYTPQTKIPFLPIWFDQTNWDGHRKRPIEFSTQQEAQQYIDWLVLRFSQYKQKRIKSGTVYLKETL